MLSKMYRSASALLCILTELPLLTKHILTEQIMAYMIQLLYHYADVSV